MTEGFDFHFIAIGGVGQSALAEILLCLGCKVSGSDLNDSKYIARVKSLGAEVYLNHDPSNIKGTPKVIVSSAIKEDNPELLRAKELNLEILHRSDCLKLISEKFPCFIGFSGTHGKTTTSGLLSFVMENMGLKPSYAIGGIIPILNRNATADKNSKYFIAELDESDGTIQKYKPDYLVINNLEADHLDYYKNGLSDILTVFKKLVSNMDENSKIFINKDNFGCQQLINDIKNKVITYSIENEADYQAKNIVFNDLKTSFDVYKKGEFLTKINLIIPGIHNVYNALSNIAVLDESGFKPKDYSKYFEIFTGMGRRFELIGEINDIKVFDDYAHHPCEIKSTLEAVKTSKRRRVVIFQPHRYTRLKALWNEFLDSFNNIDELFVLDVFCAGDKPLSDFNSENFTKEISKKGVFANYVKGDFDTVSNKISKELKSGDLVLALGAGDITKVSKQIVLNLKNRQTD